MKKWILIVVLAAAVMLGLIWFFTRQTPERQVRHKVDVLAEVVSKVPGESNALMTLKMERLRRLMADSVTIDTNRYGMAGTYTPDELASLAMRIRGMMKEVKLSFPDLAIDSLTDTEARLSSTVRFVMREGESGQEETAEVKIVLVKVDDKWLFQSFTEVQVLQR